MDGASPKQASVLNTVPAQPHSVGLVEDTVSRGWLGPPLLFTFYVFESVISLLDYLTVVRKQTAWNSRWTHHGRNCYAAFLVIGLLGLVSIASSLLLWSYKYAADRAAQVKYLVKAVIVVYLLLDLPLFILVVWFYWAYDYEAGIQRLDLGVKAIAWIIGSFIFWVAWMEKWTGFLHPRFGPEAKLQLVRRGDYTMPPSSAIPASVFREWPTQTPSLFPSMHSPPRPLDFSPIQPLDLADTDGKSLPLATAIQSPQQFTIANLGVSAAGEAALRANGLLVPADFLPLAAFAQQEGQPLHRVLQLELGLSAMDAIRITTALAA